jgi:hypothetical protein
MGNDRRELLLLLLLLLLFVDEMEDGATAGTGEGAGDLATWICLT